jgi:hypothetical protein
LASIWEVLLSDLFLGRGDDGDLSVRAKDLRTHGVVLGMTGSGKTGLSLVMLEELVMAGIPVIAIDPKGDLGNLGLAFAGLAPAAFAEWAAPGDDPAALATRWREGLAGWGLGPEKVSALADRMAVGLYTPGSESGVPVDVLGALRRPPASTLADPEATRDLVRDTVGGLLGLVGRKTDPLRDPAHIVLSTVLSTEWQQGRDPDLEGLITALVDPPFTKVGVFPLDRFFSPDDRMSLAMDLNGVVAAPSFAPWTTGVPMDLDAMLRPGARTPVSIFDIAHLGEAQRHFFVGLLMGRLLAWSRAQPGTEALRAVLFFDEVSGYLPPHPAAPPSKGPLLTIMKQARAVGLGVVLSTQNPVDLDYKALSNAGLWCIGRLQTQQDRERVLKGIGRQDLDDAVRVLEKRQFLLHNVKKTEPKIFKSRHAMCYLRGPFTRREVAAFVRGPLARPVGVRGAAPAPAPAPAAAPPAGPPPVPAYGAPAGPPPVPAYGAPAGPPPVPAYGAPAGPPPVPAHRAPVGPPPVPAYAAAATAAAATAVGATANTALPGSSSPPPLRVPFRFLDPRVAFSARLGSVFESFAEGARSDGAVLLRPALWADISLRFDDDPKGFVVEQRAHHVWFPLRDDLPETPLRVALEPDDVMEASPDGARYADLPSWADQSKEFTALKKRVVDDLYRSESRGMWLNAKLKVYGRGEEPREDFDVRCREAAEEAADAEAAKLKSKFETKLDRLHEKVRRKEQSLAKLEGALKARKVEEAVNIGETLLSFFGGRKRSLSSAMTRRRMTSSTDQRLEQAQDDLSELQAEAIELDSELADALDEISERWLEVVDQTEERAVGLEKNDIQVRTFGVLWVPVTRRI